MVGTVVPLRSSAMAVTYYERDGYYARNDPEHRQASFWFGDAAQALGLKAHVRPVALRIGAVGIRAGDGPASRPDARGRARAPAGLGHHPVGAEVGVAGGAGDGRPPGDPGSRRGGAGDARLRGGGASADPGLGPGDAAAPPGERERHGGGGVPASREPQPGPAAAHPLRAGQHDAQRLGRMAERGADEDSSAARS